MSRVSINTHLACCHTDSNFGLTTNDSPQWKYLQDPASYVHTEQILGQFPSLLCSFVIMFRYQAGTLLA